MASLRRPLCVLFLTSLACMPSLSLAGANRGGIASLSWDRAGTQPWRASAASYPFPLFLQLRNAPDIRALAVRLDWTPFDSTRACYSIVSAPQPGAPSRPDSAFGWVTNVAPRAAFNGEANFGWTIAFPAGAGTRNCVEYLVSGAGCAARSEATFQVVSAITMDSNGRVDTLTVASDARILFPALSALGVEDIAPRAVPSGMATAITITGRGFQAGDRVFVASRGERWEASGVRVASASRLSAVAITPFPPGTPVDIIVRSPAGTEAIARGIAQASPGAATAASGQCDLTPSNARRAFTPATIHSPPATLAGGAYDNVNAYPGPPDFPSSLASESLVVVRAAGDTVAIVRSEPHLGVGLEVDPHGTVPAGVLRVTFPSPIRATSVATLITGGRLFGGAGYAQSNDNLLPLVRVIAGHQNGTADTIVLNVGDHIRNTAAGSSACDGTPWFVSTPTEPGVVPLLTSGSYFYDLQEFALPGRNRGSPLASLEFTALPIDHPACVTYWGTSLLCGVTVWPKFQIQNRSAAQVGRLDQSNPAWGSLAYGGFDTADGRYYGRRQNIRANGCNLTCFTMIHRYMGLSSVTPSDLNSYLQHHGGYGPNEGARITVIADTVLTCQQLANAAAPSSWRLGDSVYVVKAGSLVSGPIAVLRAGSTAAGTWTAAVVGTVDPGQVAQVGDLLVSYGLIDPNVAAGYSAGAWEFVTLGGGSAGVGATEQALCDSMPVFLKVRGAAHFVLADGWWPSFGSVWRGGGTYFIKDPSDAKNTLTGKFSNNFCSPRAARRLPGNGVPAPGLRSLASAGSPASRLTVTVLGGGYAGITDPTGKTVLLDPIAQEYSGNIPGLVALRQETVDDDDDPTRIAAPCDLLSLSGAQAGDYTLWIASDGGHEAAVIAAGVADNGVSRGGIDYVAAGTTSRYRMTYIGGNTPLVTITKLQTLDALPSPKRPAFRVWAAVNPCGTPVELKFEGGTGERIICDVFDVRGARVRRLGFGAGLTTMHAVTWDGRSEAGETLAPGLYLIRARRGTATSHARMVLLR